MEPNRHQYEFYPQPPSYSELASNSSPSGKKSQKISYLYPCEIFFLVGDCWIYQLRNKDFIGPDGDPECNEAKIVIALYSCGSMQIWIPSEEETESSDNEESSHNGKPAFQHPISSHRKEVFEQRINPLDFLIGPPVTYFQDLIEKLESGSNDFLPTVQPKLPCVASK